MQNEYFLLRLGFARWKSAASSVGGVVRETLSTGEGSPSGSPYEQRFPCFAG